MANIGRYATDTCVTVRKAVKKLIQCRETMGSKNVSKNEQEKNNRKNMKYEKIITFFWNKLKIMLVLDVRMCVFHVQLFL